MGLSFMPSYFTRAAGPVHFLPFAVRSGYFLAGCCTEALLDKLRVMIPELLEANNQPVTDIISFELMTRWAETRDHNFFICRANAPSPIVDMPGFEVESMADP